MAFKADRSQQKVIEAQEGEHLVLAPPGCGKTQILTERLRYAHEKCGVPYEQMLCLTFTNRAARGMKERIDQVLHQGGDRGGLEGVGEGILFIGSIHRFCSKFLFDNALITADVGVIDDDDIISICARYECEDELRVASNGKRRRQYFDAVHLCSMMYQIEHRHPKSLRLHPDCLNSDDLLALNVICRRQNLQLTPDVMSDIFRRPDTYRTLTQTPAYDMGEKNVTDALLSKMELACFYDNYKRDNRLIDFNDLLLLTYETLKEPNEYRRYSWIQVDEVQDLNPLQLAIVDKLSTNTIHQTPNTKVFLGDEQQAIFSFMGAKLSTLESLKQRCAGNVHHLSVNHRSPDYLMEVYNTYASEILNIDKSLLPVSAYTPQRIGNELSVMTSNTLDTEFSDAAQQAVRFCSQNPDETVAVIVTSNKDADEVALRLADMKMSCFKVSGTDLFSLPEVKLMIAHMTVLDNEHNLLAWSRVLRGMHVYEQSASARQFVKQMSDKAMIPSDLLLFNESTYLQQFSNIYSNREIVVFDTETTGLDTENDDIVQIAAVKMKGGAVVPGSEFCIYIQTNREIPLMLGDIVNPIIEEMKHHELLSPEVAFQRFLDYSRGCVLLGHNARYDYSILDANLRRYLPQRNLHDEHPDYLDSLKLVRLLEPQLKQHKLKYLLEVLNLEGENSHLADADVAATCNVVRYCYEKAHAIIPLQQEFLSRKPVRERVRVFRQNYLGYYTEVKDMETMYHRMLEDRVISKVRNINYIFRYIDLEKPSVRELSTLKESDLCSSDVIDERIFVTTVHKAKGLEFDNVIVFDACDDRYPGYFSKDNPQLQAEDARKLYVAMTRARKRLLFTLSAVRFDLKGVPHDRQVSRFLQPVLGLFTSHRME